MSGILPDQDTTADNADENVDWHWRLSRARSDLIKGGRVRTCGVCARVGSIEYLPGIDFGLIACAVEGANHVARCFVLLFFFGWKNHLDCHRCCVL